MNGYIALISVIIISAVVLLVALSTSLLSIGESDMSVEQNLSNEALYLANLCAEEALMKLESVLDYAGGEPITVGSESCDIVSVDGSGNLDRVIKTRATVATYTRRVQVDVTQVSPELQITSWSEVAGF